MSSHSLSSLALGCACTCREGSSRLPAARGGRAESGEEESEQPVPGRVVLRASVARDSVAIPHCHCGHPHPAEGPLPTPVRPVLLGCQHPVPCGG